MRCFTVLLACCCPSPDEKALMDGKPSLDWMQLGSQDTAKECEVAKTTIIAGVAKRRKL